MARGKTKIEVNLFPFLSVLCCMIGVFTLFLVIIVSTRVSEAEGEAASPRRGGRGPGEGGAGAQGDPEAIDEQTYEVLSKRLQELEGTLGRRQRERDELERLQQQLRALIDQKKDELTVHMLVQQPPKADIGAPDPVHLVPDGRFKTPKKPIEIEVHSEGYLVQPQKTSFPTVKSENQGEYAHFAATAELKEFLEQVDKKHETEYLLLLVHPNGVEAYTNLRGYLLQEFLEKDPIPGTTLRKSRIDLGVEPFLPDEEYTHRPIKS